MDSRNFNVSANRPIADVLYEIRDELKQFAATRIQMLRSEMNERAGAIKMALPMMAGGAFIAVVAFGLLTLALVSLITQAFQPSTWASAAAFAIVGVVYAAVAAVTLLFGWRSIKAGSFKPERTLRVLRDDQRWLKKETK